MRTRTRNTVSENLNDEIFTKAILDYENPKKQKFWKKSVGWLKTKFGSKKSKLNVKESIETLGEQDIPITIEKVDSSATCIEFEPRPTITIVPSHYYINGERYRRKLIKEQMGPTTTRLPPCDVQFCIKWGRDLTRLRGKPYAPYNYYTGEYTDEKSLSEWETEAIDFFIKYYCISLTRDAQGYGLVMAQALPLNLFHLKDSYEPLINRLILLRAQYEAKK
jgi:hypothetical protein